MILRFLAASALLAGLIGALLAGGLAAATRVGHAHQEDFISVRGNAAGLSLAEAR